MEFTNCNFKNCTNRVAIKVTLSCRENSSVAICQEHGPEIRRLLVKMDKRLEDYKRKLYLEFLDYLEKGDKS